LVIDSSALVAILLAEPEALRLVEAIAAAQERHLGVPTMVEASAVMLARRGAGGEIALEALVQRLEIQVVPMSAEAGSLARRAYRRYGRGVGAPGVLNYGDCLAYGIAMASGEPLLFKGADFPQTDVLAAAY
jgi:ribonuclease VapC